MFTKIVNTRIAFICFLNLDSMKKVITVLIFVLVKLFAIGQIKTPYKSGDLLFISSKSGQGQAIQLATHSHLTHCGIVFIENNTAYVYHAVEPVQKSTLKEFLSYSDDGKIWIKRLKDTSLLNQKNITLLKSNANAMLGKHYDLYFNWSNDEIYCSEYIWKIYKNALNIEIGKIHPLKFYDLSSKIVKETMAKRYGEKIPLEEQMVAPSDIFSSENLISVE